MNISHILLVGAGGFAGSVARYLTVVTIDKKVSSAFPFGTLTVNITGSFILGILLAVLARKSGMEGTEWKLFAGTGFCGGFTTYSAFAVENVNLLQQKMPGAALLYIVLSLVAGMMAVWAGFAVVRALS